MVDVCAKFLQIMHTGFEDYVSNFYKLCAYYVRDLTSSIFIAYFGIFELK